MRRAGRNPWTVWSRVRFLALMGLGGCVSGTLIAPHITAHMSSPVQGYWTWGVTVGGGAIGAVVAMLLDR